MWESCAFVGRFALPSLELTATPTCGCSFSLAGFLSATLGLLCLGGTDFFELFDLFFVPLAPFVAFFVFFRFFFFFFFFFFLRTKPTGSFVMPGGNTTSVRGCDSITCRRWWNNQRANSYLRCNTHNTW